MVDHTQFIVLEWVNFLSSAVNPFWSLFQYLSHWIGLLTIARTRQKLTLVKLSPLQLPMLVCTVVEWSIILFMTEVLFPYSLSFNRSLVTDLKLILYNSDNSYRNRKIRITFTELDSYCLIGIYIWGDIRKFPDQLHCQLGNDLTPHTLW